MNPKLKISEKYKNCITRSPNNAKDNKQSLKYFIIVNNIIDTLYMNTYVFFFWYTDIL